MATATATRKDDAKEKERAAKAKEKEQAAKAKEKERAAKEKEKERAAKAKEKEKAAKAKEKEKAAKAKEKEKAAKAKEKEKAAKAKEKERAAKAKEKERAAKEKEKERAAKSKEKEKAAKATEQERATKGSATPDRRSGAKATSSTRRSTKQELGTGDTEVREAGYIAESLGKADAVTRSTKRPSLAASYTTRDHEIIKAWAESRGGVPADVRGTGDGEASPGVLRIEFRDPGDDLEEVSWDAFFQTFDESDVDFLYQEHTADGSESRFFKIVRADS